jgi:hypothetical protein
MKMIHSFEDFCTHYSLGDIQPDVRSHLEGKSVDFLRKRGWNIEFWRSARDLLAICRRSQDHFELAYKSAGIDFWAPDHGRPCN